MKTPFRTHTTFSVVLFAILLSIFAFSAVAQNPELSLADLVIGLRSKKATLEERNQILAAAVMERGITFVNTPEIEKELTATGAGQALITAVRAKSPKPVAPVPVATPIPTPTPPDYSFYQKRADTSLEKGDVDAALIDYNKAVEMKRDEPGLYVSRGKAHFGKKSYDLSVKDYDKAIELAPKTAIAFLNRGASLEKLGERDKALADYRKAADLEPANEAAKAEVKRIEEAVAKEAAAKAEEERMALAAARPDFLNLGSLSPEDATRLITPTYTQMARQSRVVGKVTVEVEMDEEGNVVAAKATNGPAMLRQSAEDAAKRSKFKPAMFNGTQIKAKGVITYSFTL